MAGVRPVEGCPEDAEHGARRGDEPPDRMRGRAGTAGKHPQKRPTLSPVTLHRPD